MARGQKRAASRAATSAAKKVAKECRKIEPAIKASSLPPPVRKIVAGRLVHVFGTYKEDRHAFQNTVSELVNQTLRETQADLQKAIANAEAEKSAADATGADLDAKNNEAVAASDAAKKAADDAADELSNRKTGHKEAKATLHNAEEAVKTLANDTADTKKKREGLDSVNKEFFQQVKEGTLDKGLGKSAKWAGDNLSKQHSESFEKEFVVCVVRSFSKALPEWGTFDHIVEKELAGKIQERLAQLDAEITRLEGQKEPTDAAVEAAKGAVAAAEERVKAQEEVVSTGNGAAKDAKKDAKVAGDALAKAKNTISKAAAVLTTAQKALDKFQTTALAAYESVVEHTAPPPEPEQPEPEMPAPVSDATGADAGGLEQAMEPIPMQTPSSPSLLPSPGMLLTRAASGIASAVSSRLAPSPRVAQSPR